MTRCGTHVTRAHPLPATAVTAIVAINVIAFPFSASATSSPAPGPKVIKKSVTAKMYETAVDGTAKFLREGGYQYERTDDAGTLAVTVDSNGSSRQEVESTVTTIVVGDDYFTTNDPSEWTEDEQVAVEALGLDTSPAWIHMSTLDWEPDYDASTQRDQWAETLTRSATRLP